ncbi:MAG TPA: PE family protein, partial [Mycobacterium sp.]|nr:PE family protein [Mycobacterium sp.]
MSYLVAAPEFLASAAADLSNIGSALTAANEAAVTPITEVLAAAEDEVSAAIAELLSAHGRGFQALSVRAAAFHSQFMQALKNASSTYAVTESANVSPLRALEQKIQGLPLFSPVKDLTGRPLIGNGSAGSPGSPMSQNLLVNPGFEVADPSGSGYSGVTIPGWTETGTPTVIAYGTPRAVIPFASPFPNLPKVLGFPSHAPLGGGNNFAGGGPVATSTISQTVNLSAAVGKINTGTTPYTLSGMFGG